LVVSAAIVEALEGLQPDYPKITGAKLEELQSARRALERKGA
jgi:hypothetical protein